MAYVLYVAAKPKKGRMSVLEGFGKDITSNQLNYSQKPESNKKHSSYHLSFLFT